MVSARPLISKSSTDCTNPLVIVPRALTMIGITVIFRFHSFFHFPGKVQLFILLLAFFRFYNLVSWDSKVHYSANSLFSLSIIRFGRLAKIRWSVCFSKCVSHIPEQILGCAYTISLDGRISISCTIPNGSPYPPSCVSSHNSPSIYG